MFALFGIFIERRENMYYDKHTKLPVIIMDIDTSKNGIENIPIHISGNANKLRLLGWQPVISMQDILREFKNNI